MKLIIVNGYPESGKDTFVGFCQQYCKAWLVSSVDKVKTAAMVLGWDGVKTPEARKFLSDLKDMSTQLFNGPMKYMEDCVSTGQKEGVEAVFFMIREPEEIAKFKEKYPDTLALFIERGAQGSHSNHADARVGNYAYDLIIPNNSTLNDLQSLAEDFVELVIKPWDEVRSVAELTPKMHIKEVTL